MLHFIDHTGHIFGITSYDSYPIGYEYETTPYIFWVNDEYNYKISVNNYYVLPIRFISEKTLQNVKLSVDSGVFSFGVLNEDMEIHENSLKKELTLEDLNIISGVSSKTGNKSFNIYTFYLFAISPEEGSWISNVLIEIDNTLFCPISVGATFVNEIEQLQINARNIGVKLPKDILQAVYNQSYFNESFNEKLYNEKLKEYLINHMLLKGECGNYNSVIASLKWFGWSNYIELSKLLQTDNEFNEQFIHDYFKVYNDIPTALKHFKHSTYISLCVKENIELAEVYSVNDSNDFWGEGKPKLENLFEKTTFKTYDEGDINFVQSYYKHNINEMMYKLSCLSYMLKKYFLPIHLSVLSSSVKHQVYANDIKFITNTNTTLTETPLLAIDQTNNIESNVVFPNETILYLYNQYNDKFIDSNFNYFERYTKEYCLNSEDNFYSLNNCISVKIPIKFNSSKPDTVFDCILILSRENTQIFESHFSFANNAEKYDSFNIVPICFDNKLDAKFWESTFTIDLFCNGKWYKYSFEIKIPDMDVTYYTLQYNYDNAKHKQINYITNTNIDFNAHIFEPGLVQINDVNFYEKLKNCFEMNNTFETINFNQTSIIDAPNYILNVNTLIKSNIDSIRVVENEKYLNKIYIYTLTNNLKSIDLPINIEKPFETLNKDNYTFVNTTIDLYREFFTDEGILKINCENIDDYDFYLMHDNYIYYCVFISKETIDKTPGDLCTNIIFGNYKLDKYRDSEMFLINRMELIHPEVNWFESDDIIVSKISNINMPYITSYGAKWEFSKLSLGGETIPPVYSKTNVGIMSIDKEHTSYISGYYNVTINYAIDDYFQHNRILKSKILIK